MNIDFEELHVFDNSLSTYVPREMFEKAQAESDRRLGLLRKIEVFVQVCPICLIRIKDHPFVISKRADYHAPNCELAEEIGGLR